MKTNKLSKGLLALLAVVTMLISVQTTKAQTVTIGTTALNSYLTGPYYRSSAASTFNYSRYAYLYTAAELGIPAGSQITQIEWNKASGTITGNNTFSIWLDNTGLTTLTTGQTWTTNLGAATQVFTSATRSFTTVAPGYEVFPITPFIYTGGNLKILTDHIKAGVASGANNYYRNLATNMAVGASAGTPLTGGTALTTATYGNYRPMIRISYTAGSPCVGTPAPGNTLTSSATACPSTAVNLSLQNTTSGSGVSYQWQSGPTNTGPWTNVGPSSPGYSPVISATTWFQCIVTCSTGPASGTSNPVQVTLSPFYNCYAASAATSTFDTECLNATVGTLNNTSNCVTPATGPGSVLNLYANYRGVVAAPNLDRTSTVSVSVNVNTCGGDYTKQANIWIDYNQNGVFEQPGERVWQSTYAAGNGARTGTFVVPVGATLGTTGMRVVVVEGLNTNPTGTFTYGETEDYLVTITPAPACVAPTAPTASGITATGANLSWTGAAGNYDVEWGTFGFAPTGTPSVGFDNVVNSGPHALGGLSSLTQYSYYVRQDCGGSQSSWTGPYSFGTACGGTSCNYIARLTDSFGDGWNGAQMTISQNGIVIATVGPTFTTGSGPVDVTVPICEGVGYTLNWTAGGSYPGEVGIQLIDAFGGVLFTKAPGVGSAPSLLFSGTGLCTNPLDIAPIALASPSAGGTCGGGSVPVQVTIRNSGTSLIDFSVNPVTVNVVVTGPIGPQNLSVVVNSGTLATNTNMNVTTTANADLSAQGTYTFAISAVLTGDSNPANNTLTPNPTRTVSSYAGLFPYTQQFGATPNPVITSQIVTYSPTLGFADPAWTISTTGNTAFPTLTPTNAGFATFNSFNCYIGASARLVMPCMDFSSMVTPQVRFRMSQDNGYNTSFETVTVQYSTNGGATWVSTVTQQRVIAGAAQWTEFTVPLCVLAGNTSVRLGFLANSFYGNNIHIDEIIIEDAGACPIPALAAVTGLTSTTATLNWSNLGGCGVTGYNLEWGPVGNVTANSVPGLATNTYTISAGLTPGSTYEYHVQSDCGGPTSAYSVTGTFTVPFSTPVNDNCAVPTIITPALTCVLGTSSFNGYTNAATASGVATPLCSGFTGNPNDDVWYVFQANGVAGTNYNITLTPVGTFDAVVAVYQNNSCATPTLIQCVDATFNGGIETMTVTGLTAGNIYKIRVYSYGGVGTEGQFNLCVTQIPPPPANDNCAGAIVLTSQPTCIATAGTTDWATTSTPATVCGGTANDDVWYSFVASGTTHEITVVGDAQMNPVVQLLTGTCAAMTPLTCVDLSLDGGTEVINAAGLFPGITYYVRVYDYDGGISPTPGFTICVTDVNVLTPPPVNDNCASGTVLTSAATCVTTSHTTVGATNITALPGNLCGSGVGNADDDVWFNFVCTNASQIIDVQSGPALDAVVELRTNACNGALISCSDATGVAGLESLQVNGLTIGTTYKIRVYGRGAGSTTQDVFDICVYHGVAPAAPANDNCAGAVLLSGPASPACVLTAGTVLGATASTPASVCIGTANDDVWYKFNATASTAYNVRVVGSAQFDAVIQVLNGGVSPGNCASLTSVNCTDISGQGGTEIANLTGLTVGNTYFIRVYDYGAAAPATSTFQICVNYVTPPPPPANDNCAGATLLIPSGTCSPTAGTTLGATTSAVAVSCVGTANDDVWYKFVATSTIHKVQVTASTGFAAVVEVMTSTAGACGSILNLACGNAAIIGTPVVVTLPGLTIGNTYFVRVYDFFAVAPATPTFDICVVTIPAPPVPTNDLCANAIGVACGDLITGQNSNGGTSTSDPTGVCGTDVSNINAIWYRVTGNGNSYEINTCNFNGYDTKLAVFSGTCGALACVGGNDDTPGCGNGLASSVTWQTVNGVDYWIMVGGFAGQQGIFQLQVNCCNSATIGGTTTVTPDPATSVVNDAYTFGVTGSNGLPTQWQFSLNNFTTIAGTFTANGPNLTLIDNVNGTVWIRAVMSAGAGCLPVNSSTLAVTPICASPITGQPQNTGSFITNFQLADLNNNSTYDSFDMYQNFTNLSATVTRGLSYQMKIKTNGAVARGRMVWIDYNNDGDYLDAGENAITPQAPTAGVSTHIITIPCVGVGPIQVKCRVLVCNTTPNVNPCAAVTYTNGEIEEYTINIEGDGFGTWTGLVSNQWSDPNNWACLQVPNASTNVVFPVGAPNVPAQLTGAAVCNNITFVTAGPFYVSPGLNLNGNTLSVKGDFVVAGSANASAVFSCNGTIDFNGTLGAQNVYGRPTFGNLTINNAAGVTLNNPTGVQCILRTTAGVLTAGNNLTLRSSLTSTGLIDPTGTGSVVGNVTVQRKIGATTGYHYLSSPVAGSVVNTPANGWSDDFIITAAYDNFVYDPTVPAFSTFPQVWEYDETNPNPNPAYGWIGATNGDALTALKGFACVVPAGAMVDVFGVVNNGNVGPYAVTAASDGLNLLGNPYPSPISWNAFRAHNPSVSATYQAFVTTGGYGGNYGTYDGVTGTNGVGNVIASSQAFFVTAVAPGTVSAVNADRTTDVNPTFFSYTSVPNLLRMEVNGMGSADESVVYFDPTSVSTYDASRDGIKILPTGPGVASLYTLVDNHMLSINVMGDLNQDYSIPLGVRIQAAGTYDIKATDLSSMAPTAMVYLEDLVTGTMQNLRQNAVYTVNLAANDYTNRFVLHFHPALGFNGNGETCAGNDGTIGISYPSASTVNVSVKNSAGAVVSTLNNFNGTTTISNLTSGNYTVEAGFVGGFISTDYVQVAAGNAVAANMTASTQSVDLSNNASVVFTATANGATSYNWNFGDGTVINNGPANVSHLFTTAGVYDVTFEATNSICSSVAHASVTVLNPTGIVTNNAEGVKVFGTENRVSVQFGSIADGKGRIEVLNMLGQSVVDVEVNTTKGTREIEVPNNAVGHYMVRVTTANKVYTQKVYLTK